MEKASKKKRQQDSHAESILNGKSLISSDISSKWSLFNKPTVHFFLIAIVGLLAYSNTFHVPFQWDDTPNIVENYKLRDLSNLWPPTGSRWFGFLTFALNYHFGGLNTLGYHVVNIAIHILNAILVYWLVVLTFKTPYFSASNPPSPPFSKGGMGGFALFSALLFVAHPIQTQAITYIVQRFTSLATMFYLLSLVMYIKFRSQQSAISPPTQPSPSRGEGKGEGGRYTLYTVSFISAVLAMKTKEIAFTLPVVIALYEFMFFEGKIKKRLLYLIPLLFTMLIIPLSLVGIDKPIGDTIAELSEAAQETEEISRWSYLFTQFRVIVTYTRLLFLPINQNFDYDYPLYHSFFEPNVFLSFVFLLIIFALGIYFFYTKRYTLYATRLTAFGIFWFFITLSVESSIIPIKDVIFEHRVYLPSVGAIIAFSIAIFYVLHFVIQRSRISTSYFPLSTSYFLLLSTVVIVLSGATYTKNIVWQDEVSLWEDAVKKSPEKARSHNELGNVYKAKGWIDKAIEHYQIALRLNPYYAGAHNNLGNAYNKKGQIDKAIEHYLIALRLKPNYGEIHNNLGNVYKAKGWIDKAIEHYQTALRLIPYRTEVHNNLGMAYERKWLFDKAIEEYRAALRLNPKDETARDNLNRILQIKR